MFGRRGGRSGSGGLFWRRRFCVIVINCLLQCLFGQETDNAVLTLSVGVTTVILSTAPATIPARIPRPAESFPRSSEREFLIVSNERNRTAALAVVPCMASSEQFLHNGTGNAQEPHTIINVEHPVYKDPTPSCRATCEINLKGSAVGAAPPWT